MQTQTIPEQTDREPAESAAPERPAQVNRPAQANRPSLHPAHPARSRRPLPPLRLTTDELKRAVKRQFRAARAAGHPIKWQEARKRALAWERGRAGDHMWSAS